MKYKKNKHQNKDWLDWWLSDDPPSPVIESTLQKSRATLPPEDYDFDETDQRASTLSEPGATNITVNVNVPKINNADLQKLKKRLSQRDVAKAAGFAVGMMLVGLAAHSFIFTSPQTPASNNGDSHQVLSETTQGANAPTQKTSLAPAVATSTITPSQALPGSTGSTNSNTASFQPAAPSGEPDLGNYAFGKTSYDSSTGIYLYEDMLDGYPISVSQQKIPSSYSSAQDAVSAIASSIGANQIFPIDSGNAYMYTSPGNNAHQTVVFTLFGILISINSNLAHTPSVWQAYINTLH